MKKEFDIYSLYPVFEIMEFYSELKEDGQARIDEIVLTEYEDEQSDVDDAPMLYISLALCHLKYEGRVPKRLQNKVLQLVQSDCFLQRFIETEDTELMESFEEWKRIFTQQVKDGIPLPPKKRKKSKRLPQMTVGDVFRVRFKNGGLEKYGTVLMIVVDFLEYNKTCEPVVYLAHSSNPIESQDDFCNADLHFVPVSYRFEKLDYQRVLVDRSISEELGILLDKICNVSNYPRPSEEFLPKDLMGRVSLDSIKQDLEIGAVVEQKYRFRY